MSLAIRNPRIGILGVVSIVLASALCHWLSSPSATKNLRVAVASSDLIPDHLFAQQRYEICFREEQRETYHLHHKNAVRLSRKVLRLRHFCITERINDHSLARDLIDLEEYQATIALIDSLPRTDEAFFGQDCHLLRGEALAGLSRFQEAKHELALALDGNNISDRVYCHWELYKIFLAENDLPETTKHLNQAVPAIRELYRPLLRLPQDEKTSIKTAHAILTLWFKPLFETPRDYPDQSSLRELDFVTSILRAKGNSTAADRLSRVTSGLRCM
jgi:hypothetical protein